MRSSLLTVLALTVAVGCGGRTVGGGTLKKPQLGPVKAEALKEFDAGMRAMRLGGPEAASRAKDRLTTATEIDSSIWEAWHNLGVLALEDGDGDAAVDAFSQALKINPANISSYLGRAEAYRKVGQTKNAASDYKVIIKQQPEERRGYARLASLHREAKAYEDGLDVLRDALRVAGADSSIYVELALIYLGQGRDELAELILAKATALNDKEPSVHNAMALIHLSRGNDQAAFERFDYATSLDPKYVDARFNSASVLLDSGDYERAKTSLEQVVKQSPEDFDAKVALGIALRGLKKYKLAGNIWEDVVKSAPRRSRVRGDALFNLAVLEQDIKMEESSAKAALDRYLQESWSKHHKRKEAEERRKDLGP